MPRFKSELISTHFRFPLRPGFNQDNYLIFRRLDNKKRINVCGLRYGLSEEVLVEIMKATSVDMLPVDAEIALDNSGNVIEFEVSDVKVKLPKVLYGEYASDIFAMKHCLEEILQRVEFIRISLQLCTSEEVSKHLSPPLFESTFAANYHYQVTETVGLQYRQVFELLAKFWWSALDYQMESTRIPYSTWEISRICKELSRRFGYESFPQPLDYDCRVLNAEQVELFTPQKLLKYHGLCANLLHAATPYKMAIDWQKYLANFFGGGKCC